MTSKLQVTIPKAIAEQYRIAPGSDIAWLPARDAIRVTVVPTSHEQRVDPTRRLALFDSATERQRARESTTQTVRVGGEGRGWRREELHTRGPSD